MKIVIILIVTISPFLKIFSQSNQLDPIIDTSANYSSNLSYNIGEVFVVFLIQDELIVSKVLNETVINTSDESADESITIYPNPVNDLLNILTIGEKKVKKIMIFSMDGRIILEKEIQNNQIDLTNLPEGTYILKTDIYESKNFTIIKL